jgi:hypothetical protein
MRCSDCERLRLERWREYPKLAQSIRQSRFRAAHLSTAVVHLVMRLKANVPNELVSGYSTFWLDFAVDSAI